MMSAEVARNVDIIFITSYLFMQVRIKDVQFRKFMCFYKYIFIYTEFEICIGLSLCVCHINVFLLRGLSYCSLMSLKIFQKNQNSF